MASRLSHAVDHLLAVVADLDEEVLLDIYGIDPKCEAPLDEAIYEYRSALAEEAAEEVPGQ